MLLPLPGARKGWAARKATGRTGRCSTQGLAGASQDQGQDMWKCKLCGLRRQPRVDCPRCIPSATRPVLDIGKTCRVYDNDILTDWQLVQDTMCSHTETAQPVFTLRLLHALTAGTAADVTLRWIDRTFVPCPIACLARCLGCVDVFVNTRSKLTLATSHMDADFSC